MIADWEKRRETAGKLSTETKVFEDHFGSRVTAFSALS